MQAVIAKTSGTVAVLGLLTAIPAAAHAVHLQYRQSGRKDGDRNTSGKFEIESADDLALTGSTSITSATFTGLLKGATVANIGKVRVEIYRYFQPISDVGRTSGPPTFSTSQVPTRVNSPSDVEFADRDTASSNLTFTTKVLSNSFTALNTVQPGGIHPKPNQTTGGDGSVSGQEVEFDVNFTSPFSLPADHYFLAPQVEITTAGGEFLWLSAPRPIVSPGTPFPADFTDLQSWTRDQFLAPDWLRIGTDIVGGETPPTFNATFSLAGQMIPEPASLSVLGAASREWA